MHNYASFDVSCFPTARGKWIYLFPSTNASQEEKTLGLQAGEGHYLELVVDVRLATHPSHIVEAGLLCNLYVPTVLSLPFDSFERLLPALLAED